MIVCLIFVFCALLEFAFVNVAARNGVRIRAPIVRQASLRAALENTDLLAQQVMSLPMIYWLSVVVVVSSS